MSKKVSCFVAYPSNPPALAETIEGAIKQLNEGQVVNVIGWKSTSVTGKFIITTICEAISERDIFMCDLSNLNPNVLFELGFAIARNKRIWPIFDDCTEKSTIDYRNFRLLSTVGYQPYKNVHDIVDAFYKEEPYNDLQDTIFRETIEPIIRTPKENSLLYLKSGIETEASVKLTRLILKSKIPTTIDDPQEVRVQPLSWYAQRVFSGFALIAHFLSSEHTGARYHNAKNA